MMLAAGQCRFEAGAAAAEIDSVEEAEVGELLERAVDAGDADGATVGADSVEDFLGGEAAVLGGEVSDDRIARAARSRAGAAEFGVRVFVPAELLCSRHG
jgi:hypothetical protein